MADNDDNDKSKYVDDDMDDSFEYLGNEENPFLADALPIEEKPVVPEAHTPKNEEPQKVDEDNAKAEVKKEEPPKVEEEPPKIDLNTSLTDAKVKKDEPPKCEEVPVKVEEPKKSPPKSKPAKEDEQKSKSPRKSHDKKKTKKKKKRKASSSNRSDHPPQKSKPKKPRSKNRSKMLDVQEETAKSKQDMPRSGPVSPVEKQQKESHHVHMKGKYCKKHGRMVYFPTDSESQGNKCKKHPKRPRPDCITCRHHMKGCKYYEGDKSDQLSATDKEEQSDTTRDNEEKIPRYGRGYSDKCPVHGKGKGSLRLGPNDQIQAYSPTSGRGLGRTSLRNVVKLLQRRTATPSVAKMGEGDSVAIMPIVFVFMWYIKKVIGGGQYGYVYEVDSGNEEQRKAYALKTEVRNGYKSIPSRLAMEIVVLRNCFQKEEECFQKHFLHLIDKGKTDDFNFMVMDLAGPCLTDIRNKYTGEFSKETALNIANQTIDAIRFLHRYGFLHRDIKPENFVVGLEPNDETVYLIDFSAARAIYRMKIEDGREVKKLKDFRKATQAFLGSVRFAPRASHYGIDQGRKEDLESWLYMVYDIFDSEEGLPWKHDDVRRDVVKCKAKLFRHEYSSCYKKVPKNMMAILDYLNKLKYEDEPNYSMITDTLMQIATEQQLDPKKLPDWIGKLPKREQDKKDYVRPVSKVIIQKRGEIDNNEKTKEEEDDSNASSTKPMKEDFTQHSG